MFYFCYTFSGNKEEGHVLTRSASSKRVHNSQNCVTVLGIIVGGRSFFRSVLFLFVISIRFCLEVLSNQQHGTSNQ